MSHHRQAPARQAAAPTDTGFDAGLQAFFSGTYRQMSYAMLLTGLVAWLFGRDLDAVMAGESTALLPASLLEAVYLSPLLYLVMLAPLGLVLVLGGAIGRMPPARARTALYAFSALMGISVATIFAHYTNMSIAQTFAATAGAFAGLSVWGYATERDLGPMGRFLFMGLVGLILVAILNLFIASGPLAMTISTLAVLIFAGLTAYDTQTLKTQYLELAREGGAEADIDRLSVVGALRLYLDFLNMFLALLHLFGAQD